MRCVFGGGGDALARFLEAGFDGVKRVEGEINGEACDGAGLVQCGLISTQRQSIQLKLAIHRGTSSMVRRPMALVCSYCPPCICLFADGEKK